jgi:pyrroline-5-carboxylate reductase
MADPKNILFLGAGNMGAAILRGLVASGYSAASIYFYEPNESAAQHLSDTGAQRVPTTLAGFEKAEVVILCIKPQVFSHVAPTLRSDIEKSKKNMLFISVMAGVSRERLMTSLGLKTDVVRTMPNLPLTVGQGTVAIATDDSSEEAIAQAESIFATCGTPVRVQESQMNAVTGLSGSGPAYVFQFIEGLVLGGVKAGLPRETAMKLAIATLQGSAAMLLASDKSPSDLTAMVSSPGGTTIAGLQVLEDAALRGTLMRTVEAATKRSAELGG